MGPFSVQVFRTSAPSKGQRKNGNGKKAMQHTEHSATDNGRRPAVNLTTTLRCVSPLPARPGHPATSAGSGRTGRIRRSRRASIEYSSSVAGSSTRDQNDSWGVFLERLQPYHPTDIFNSFSSVLISEISGFVSCGGEGNLRVSVVSASSPIDNIQPNQRFGNLVIPG